MLSKEESLSVGLFVRGWEDTSSEGSFKLGLGRPESIELSDEEDVSASSTRFSGVFLDVY